MQSCRTVLRCLSFPVGRRRRCSREYHTTTLKIQFFYQLTNHVERLGLVHWMCSYCWRMLLHLVL